MVWRFFLGSVALATVAGAASVKEHPCKVALQSARCGSVEVLEDRTKPSGRTIPIEFIQVRSTTAGRDPAAVIEVAGGPGVSGTADAENLIGIFAYVSRHHDLVLYDQRGTGGSNPLHCSLRANVQADQAVDFLPEQGVRQCYAQTAPPADLQKYNTAESVEDLDELRAALGYDRIILHALSYGTRLSQAYMQAHPEHVRAALLEGVVPPGFRIPMTFSRGMEATLSAVLADCRADARCKPVADQVDLPTITRMKQIAFTAGGATIRATPQQFFEMMRPLLYDGEGARRVPLLLAEVTRGDNSGVGRLYARVYRDDPHFSWPLWLSITCAEDTPFIRETEIGPAVEGTLAGDYRIRQQQRACRAWPVPKHDPALGKPTDVPVLLVEGQVDLVTPPWTEDDVRRRFPNGRQVVLPFTGHMPTGLDGLECLDNIEEQFLTTLDNKNLDLSCLKNIHRKPFIVEEAAR